MASLPNLDLGTFNRVALTPGTKGWWSSVPAVPDWYAVETNAPVSAIEVLAPGANCANHYNFSRRAAAAAFLRTYGQIILPPAAGQPYVVYSGEGRDLKARAREHTHGNGGTGCLGLGAYATLTKYTWSFPCITLAHFTFPARTETSCFALCLSSADAANMADHCPAHTEL